MATKVTKESTKAMLLQNLSLSDHWRLETWAKNHGLGKYEAAEKILRDTLRNVKLDVAQ